MEFLIGLAALFFLAEFLFPATTDRGELMFPEVPRRVIYQEDGKPLMYIDADPRDFRLLEKM